MPITFLYKQPRKFSFKKPFKHKIYNNDKIRRPHASTVLYSYYGLKSLQAARIKYIHLEALRRAWQFFFKYEARLMVRLQFNSPVTAKSVGVRMGRGKGKIYDWVANVKPGETVLEINKSIPLYKLPSALRVIRERVPVRLKLIKILTT